MSIEDNIAARKAADEAFELMRLSIKEADISPEAMAVAWQRVHTEIGSVMLPTFAEPEPTDSSVMSDQEAKRFERSTMTFGKHEGEQIKDVPMSYLLWIDGDEFRADLRRYLRREEVQQEQERELA